MSGKKGSRYKTDEKLERFLKDTWLGEKSKGKDKTWYEISGIVLAEFDASKMQRPVMPGKRKGQMILKQARVEYDGMPQSTREAIEEMGKPWMIGAKVDISHEALPSVLRCSKEAQISGLSFTIREAKWCARLSSSIKGIKALRVWAYAYANRELAYEILVKDFETADLDEILTTPPWEMATAYLVGTAKPLETGLYKFDENRSLTKRPIPTTTPPMIIGSGVVEIEPSLLHFQAKVAEVEFLYGPDAPKGQEIFKAISAKYGWLLQQGWFEDEECRKQWIEHPEYQEFAKAWKPIFEVASIETMDFSQEAIRVYTLWLGYLAEGPRMVPLEGLNSDEIRDLVLDRLNILLQLREWIKNHKLANGSEKLSTPPWPLIRPLDSAVALFGLKPIDILRKVGYEN